MYRCVYIKMYNALISGKHTNSVAAVQSIKKSLLDPNKYASREFELQ